FANRAQGVAAGGFAGPDVGVNIDAGQPAWLFGNGGRGRRRWPRRSRHSLWIPALHAGGDGGCCYRADRARAGRPVARRDDRTPPRPAQPEFVSEYFRKDRTMMSLRFLLASAVLAAS